MHEISKLPPQATELERAVLGAIIVEREAIFEVLGIWGQNSCYDEKNNYVYQAILNLHNINAPIDIRTVTEELKRIGKLEYIGGPYYVVSLTNGVFTNIEYHARIVQQKFLQREMILMCTGVVKKAYEDGCDVFDLMDENANALAKLLAGIHTNKIDSIGEVKDLVIQDCVNALETGDIKGIHCGITELNVHMNGWQNSTLTIVAARPGMGKTAFALDCALVPAKNGIPVAFFSMEMTKEQLGARALSMESSMPVQKIVNRQVNLHDITLLKEDGKQLDGIPLFIDDTPEMTINELKNRARRMKREKGVKLIIVDYLQLMKGTPDKKGIREQEISEISRGLKVLSRELEIPIIALSQLSRAVELRPDKKPQLSDLRESGAIEQDADNVIFLFRPEYYGFETYQVGNQDYASQGLFIFILAKFRNGGLGEIKAKWIGYLTKIVNYVSAGLQNNEEF